jgi:hypothetical protein
LVLNAETTDGSIGPRPGGGEFGFEVEGTGFVGHVTWGEEEDEGYPEEEGVDG